MWNEPKFALGDDAVIENGFYRGRVGQIEDTFAIPFIGRWYTIVFYNWKDRWGDPVRKMINENKLTESKKSNGN